MAAKRLSSVRVFDQKGSLPTDITDVTETWSEAGLYTVIRSGGQVFRFPISDISLITETPQGANPR